MTHYFLFGQEACLHYNEGDINQIILNGLLYDVAKFEYGIDNVLKLLYEYTGWGDFTEITKDDYELLNNANNETKI